MSNHQNRKISIEMYQTSWKEDYIRMATHLRQILPTAIRIDHIGSTSVVGLEAKDIVDIQVTVRQLQPKIIDILQQHSYQAIADIRYDFFLGEEDDSPQLRKYFAKEIYGDRRANIHIRQDGCLNQKYALLFRDYLRYSSTTRKAYVTIKKRLAEIFPCDIDGYLSVKDPVMDMIFVAAQSWGKNNHWQPDQDYI